jgi:ketosteroid isomerase-like protein
MRATVGQGWNFVQGVEPQLHIQVERGPTRARMYEKGQLRQCIDATEEKMTAKISALVVGSLVVFAIALVSISHAQTSKDADKTEVLAAFQNVMAAYNKGDVGTIMTFYADDGIFFEDTIPFQFNKAALRSSLEDFYKSVSGFHGSADSVDLRLSGHLAVMHCILRNGWTGKSGPYSQTSRLTEVYVKEGGKWHIWNEHLSVPFDPATGKAVLNAKP